MSGLTAERRQRLFGTEASIDEFNRIEEVRRAQSMEVGEFIFKFEQSAEEFEPPVQGSQTTQILRAMYARLQQRLAAQPAVETLDAQSNLALSACMERVRGLVHAGRVREARQYLHEVIEDLLQRGKFATVNAILFSAIPMTDDPRIIISLLTATKPAKEYLPLRADFFARSADAPKQRNFDEPGLLAGLD